MTLPQDFAIHGKVLFWLCLGAERVVKVKGVRPSWLGWCLAVKASLQLWNSARTI